MTNTMTVYRASAGSGKTFTLALRYIALLIAKPNAYREILAVTFTNKATEEMKSRIMSYLYGLSSGTADKNFLARLQEETQCNEPFIRKQAQIALTAMLHDYTSVSVETIDAFFQRILRNMARELGKTSAMRIELNDKDLKDIAVARLFANLLARKDNVKRWISEYIRQNVDDDDTGDVLSNITKFGDHIFDDAFRENETKLKELFDNEANPRFFADYVATLNAIARSAEQEMMAYYKEFEGILDKYGITVGDLLRAKSGPAGYFYHISNQVGTGYLWYEMGSTVQAILEDCTKWFTLAKQIAFCGEELTALVKRCECRRQEIIQAGKAATVPLIIKNLHSLRLLNAIQEEFNEMNVSNNSFILRDTPDVLKAMIGVSDTPFVYERIGGQVRHTMIDEFQDTSTVQWHNFKMLLRNSLAEGGQNLIVGDVKQSIYRWRGGEWSTLHNIAREFEGGPHGAPDLRTLDTNFRSERNIIEFNNAFFLDAARVMSDWLRADGNSDAELVTDIYKEELLCQNANKGVKRGLIDVRLLAKPEDGQTLAERYIEQVRELLAMLKEQGAAEQDIAILCRRTADITTLANALKDDYAVVSDEAFKLEASLAVRLIIAAMRLLRDGVKPNVKNNHLIEFEFIRKNVCQNVALAADRRREISEDCAKRFAEQFYTLRGLPLTAIAEELYVMFRLDELATSEGAYINCFMDNVDSFACNNIPSLDAFIEQWDRSLHAKSVPGGKMTGIRLMTIHKAKGLEWDHVIVPYCDWQLEPGARNRSLLWCKTDVEPFNQLPIIPIIMEDKLKNTIFNEEYHREKLQVHVDNLNLLYVAFTRAGKNLFVIGKNTYSLNKQTGGSVSRKTVAGVLQEALFKTGGLQKGDLQITQGELYIKPCEQKNKAQTTQNPFTMESERHDVPTFLPALNTMSLRQSDYAANYFQYTEQTQEDKNQQRYMTRGRVMHDILSRIETVDDLHDALADVLIRGQFESEYDCARNEHWLRKTIAQSRSERGVQAKDWFAPGLIVINERAILSSDSEGKVLNRRPDRIVIDPVTGCCTVIDYKFGKPHEEYQAQVREYMHLMQRMGYKDVRGYLWYVYKYNVEEVTL